MGAHYREDTANWYAGRLPADPFDEGVKQFMTRCEELDDLASSERAKELEAWDSAETYHYEQLWRPAQSKLDAFEEIKEYMLQDLCDTSLQRKDSSKRSKSEKSQKKLDDILAEKAQNSPKEPSPHGNKPAG